jgi:hypothetical protein
MRLPQGHGLGNEDHREGRLARCKGICGEVRGFKAGAARSAELCRVPNYAGQTRPVGHNDASNKRARHFSGQVTRHSPKASSSSLKAAGWRQLAGFLRTVMLQECAGKPTLIRLISVSSTQTR